MIQIFKDVWSIMCQTVWQKTMKSQSLQQCDAAAKMIEEMQRIKFGEVILNVPNMAESKEKGIRTFIILYYIYLYKYKVLDTLANDTE